MKYLSERITTYVIKAGAITEESYTIYQYGFQIGLEMISCFIVCLGIAILLHMIPQFIVFTTIFILLRTYAGGVHLSSYFGCFICSVAIQTLVLLVNDQYIIPLPVSWGIIFIGAILTLINAPVENINRELDKEEKKHCKKITFYILTGIVLFSCGSTVAGMNRNVSLVSLTILVVLISQYLGMIKYQIEQKGRG